MALETIFNHTEISANLAIGGQPIMDNFPMIADEGYDVVIHLIVQETITETSQWEKEALWVESAGMDYKNIKVQISEPSEEVILELCQTMREYDDKKIYLHCAAGSCASILLTGYRMICKDMPLEEANKDVQHIWHDKKEWIDLFKRIQNNDDLKNTATKIA